MKKTSGTFLKQYATFWRFLRRYFHDYGGPSAVFGSPLFGASLLVTFASYHTWLQDDWVDSIQSVIPNLLGFSLGTYALLFSLISPNIRKALRNLRNSRDVRYLDEMNATFFHFLLVQTICFLWSFLYNQSTFYDIAKIISINFPSEINLFPLLETSGSFFGVLLLVYSVFLVAGSSLVVFRIARLVDPAEG